MSEWHTGVRGLWMEKWLQGDLDLRLVCKLFRDEILYEWGRDLVLNFDNALAAYLYLKNIGPTARRVIRSLEIRWTHYQTIRFNMAALSTILFFMVKECKGLQTVNLGISTQTIDNVGYDETILTYDLFQAPGFPALNIALYGWKGDLTVVVSPVLLFKGLAGEDDVVAHSNTCEWRTRIGYDGFWFLYFDPDAIAALKGL